MGREKMGVSKGKEQKGQSGTCASKERWYQGGQGVNLRGRCANPKCASQNGESSKYACNIQQCFGHGLHNLSLLCGDWTCPECKQAIVASKKHPIMVSAFKCKFTFRTINSNTGETLSEKTGETAAGKYERLFKLESSANDGAVEVNTINEIETIALSSGAGSTVSDCVGAEKRDVKGEETVRCTCTVM